MQVSADTFHFPGFTGSSGFVLWVLTGCVLPLIPGQQTRMDRMDQVGSSDLLSITPPFNRLRSLLSTAGMPKRFGKCR